MAYSRLGAFRLMVPCFALALLHDSHTVSLHRVISAQNVAVRARHTTAIAWQAWFLDQKEQWIRPLRDPFISAQSGIGWVSRYGLLAERPGPSRPKSPLEVS